MDLADGTSAIALDLSTVGEFVSFAIHSLLSNSTETFRLSFLPHVELANYSSSGDFWSVIQTLKRTCLSSGRIPRVTVLTGSIARKHLHLSEVLVKEEFPFFGAVSAGPTVSGTDLDDFFASLAPTPNFPASTPDTLQQHQNLRQPLVIDETPATPATPGRGLMMSFDNLPETAFSAISFIDPAAAFLGAVPYPTVDFIPTDDSAGASNIKLEVSAQQHLAPLQNQQQLLSGPRPSDRGRDVISHANSHQYAPAPYSRAAPPVHTSSSASSEMVSIVSNVAQSKSVVTDPSQISTAWSDGHAYVPLYISTAYVIGGGSTPTDARRWLNRAAAQYQPTDDDLLPAKVAGALPRVRYVKWGFVERLILSSGLETSVPKEKLQYLRDKISRFELLQKHVMSEVDAGLRAPMPETFQFAATSGIRSF